MIVTRSARLRRVGTEFGLLVRCRSFPSVTFLAPLVSFLSFLSHRWFVTAESH